MISKGDFEKLTTHVRDKLNPEFILLFGSYARNEATETSDVDIAYFSTKTKLTSYDRFMLAGELAQITNVDVDLVDLQEVDTVFAALIYSTGELLDCKNKECFYKERMRALSLYAALNEQRAEILSSIKERGTIYGE